MTNLAYIINEWDDNNADEGSSNGVDSDTIEKPGRATIIDNLS